MEDYGIFILLGVIIGIGFMIFIVYTTGTDVIMTSVLDDICKEHFGDNWAWEDSFLTERKLTCFSTIEQRRVLYEKNK